MFEFRGNHVAFIFMCCRSEVRKVSFICIQMFLNLYSRSLRVFYNFGFFHSLKTQDVDVGRPYFACCYMLGTEHLYQS
jgi:hypothetical protein